MNLIHQRLVYLPIGQCGDDVPRTEMFKSTTTDKAGEVVSIKYEHRQVPDVDVN